MPASVCVFGSANMDLVAYVDRAPEIGETVTGSRFLQVPGGKGANQAVAAARAGGRVALAGAVGDDAFGAQLRRLYVDEGVDVSALALATEVTGTAHIVVDSRGGNAIVVIPGANGTVTELPEPAAAAVAEADMVLLQLELPVTAVEQAAVHARRAGTRVVLTPAPVVELPSTLLAATDLLVPNQHEAAHLTGERDPSRAASLLLSMGAAAVVVTLGDQGCLYADASGSIQVPALEVKAVDTTGAGDVLVGALAVALTEGRDVPDALAWATAAAALSVQQPGASSSAPSRAAIEALFAGRRSR